jgi:hypothetical protein
MMRKPPAPPEPAEPKPPETPLFAAITLKEMNEGIAESSNGTALLQSQSIYRHLDSVGKNLDCVVNLIIGFCDKMAVGSLLLGMFQGYGTASWTALVFFLTALLMVLTKRTS